MRSRIRQRRASSSNVLVTKQRMNCIGRSPQQVAYLCVFLTKRARRASGVQPPSCNSFLQLWLHSGNERKKSKHHCAECLSICLPAIIKMHPHALKDEGFEYALPQNHGENVVDSMTSGDIMKLVDSAGGSTCSLFCVGRKLV